MHSGLSQTSLLDPDPMMVLSEVGPSVESVSFMWPTCGARGAGPVGARDLALEAGKIHL